LHDGAQSWAQHSFQTSQREVDACRDLRPWDVAITGTGFRDKVRPSVTHYHTHPDQSGNGNQFVRDTLVEDILLSRLKHNGLKPIGIPW
jgi:hypothetical protein